MYIKKNFFLFGTLVLIITSCNGLVSNEMISEATESFTVNNYRLSIEEAQQNVLNFVAEMDKPEEGTITKRSKIARTIKNVEIFGKNNIATYSSTDETNALLSEIISAVDVDTLFYFINFDGNQGFAIHSADKRSSIIYAVIDEGNMNMEKFKKTDNPGFIMFMENVIEIEKKLIESFDPVNTYAGAPPQTIGGYQLLAKVTPILKTKWGQNNNYGTNYGQRCPNLIAGCAATAMAQLLSHYQIYNNITYFDPSQNTNFSISLNWNQIISDSESLTPFYGGLSGITHSTSSYQVAHFMYYLGLQFSTVYNFNPNSSSTNVSNIINWLNSNPNLLPEVYTYFYQADYAAAFIRAGYLVYMTGSGTDNNGTLVGHAWIIDGYLYYAMMTNTMYYAHCNWGWHGDCDGYYYGSVFNMTSCDDPDCFTDIIDKIASKSGLVLNNSFTSIFVRKK